MISECTENGDNSAQESVAMVGAKMCHMRSFS